MCAGIRRSITFPCYLLTMNSRTQMPNSAWKWCVVVSCFSRTGDEKQTLRIYTKLHHTVVNLLIFDDFSTDKVDVLLCVWSTVVRSTWPDKWSESINKNRRVPRRVICIFSIRVGYRPVGKVHNETSFEAARSLKSTGFVCSIHRIRDLMRITFRYSANSLPNVAATSSKR